ncbi:hypothetical protein M2651_05690 [Clostridium sp. SYSU_GA19001]|uniref:hypothetical protein n=1 Tax=Clostridium caldaquaticum TaxID=2940653 RepID=UPI0020770C98|nr:hypothetical protein [Clostridium caldaquaticum]MCM8710517.1 hypothetical protein [Clostridium caldaquaticum]
MIDREYRKFILICDMCGEEVNGFKTFEDALEYGRPNGWESDIGERLDLTTGYIDICPRCGGRSNE